MDTNIIVWPRPSPSHPQCLKDRLEAVLAIFAELHDGELLSAFPECEIARSQHQRALCLLGLAERELIDLWTSAVG